MFDVDKTGSIDVKEFGALLRALGLVCYLRIVPRDTGYIRRDSVQATVA